MRQILDAHIHSRYSRACSPDLTLPNIEIACEIKGIDIVATGDFTHPRWFLHIKKELVETNTGSGLYYLKSSNNKKVKFILSSEVALIYKDQNKVRKIHLVIHAPNIEAAEKLNDEWSKRFNLRSDGRPILGMSAPQLVQDCLKIDKRFLIYPAHIWTPWFAVFGSKSGFDSIAECFGEETKNIYAYETGLSSDPEMNWRLSALDKLTLLSSSDAHSLANIGREATILDLDEVTYNEIYQAIKNKDIKKIKETIEFYPEEGMYHFDGHRACHFSCSPEVSKKNKGLCPICKKPLTLGVAYRVDELADRPLGFVPKNISGYRKLVGLEKIIAESFSVKSRQSKKVQAEYHKLIKNFGSELDILLDVDLKKMGEVTPALIVEGIRRVRMGELIVHPGFDGEYGVVNIFSDKEKIKNKK
ncbi:MAG: endonuclease Q family protein [Candidatus Falkowbacteria bacterium]